MVNICFYNYNLDIRRFMIEIMFHEIKTCCLCVCVYVVAYRCGCVCMCVYACVCVWMRVYVCVCVYMSVYVCVIRRRRRIKNVLIALHFVNLLPCYEAIRRYTSGPIRHAMWPYVMSGSIRYAMWPYVMSGHMSDYTSWLYVMMSIITSLS